MLDLIPKCPKCKKMLVSESDLLRNTDSAISYLASTGIKLIFTGNIREPRWGCMNKKCKWYLEKTPADKFWLKVLPVQIAGKTKIVVVPAKISHSITN